MKLKIIIPLIAILLVGVIVVGLIFFIIPPSHPPIPSSRKAIILASANDFYASEAEDDFNTGFQSNFSGDSGRWIQNFTNGYGGPDNVPGVDGNPGALHLVANTNPDPLGYVNLEYTYNWTNYHDLQEYAFYNLSAWVNIPTLVITTSVGLPGARVGLRWFGPSGTVRTDWSNGLNATAGQWELLQVTGVCNNATGNVITEFQLILAVEGNMTHNDEIFFDDVKVDKWIAVNVTDPIDTNPPPNRIDSDGFPAQALHVYWILKSNGYTDDNIFLMLYHTNDLFIEIKAGEGNALTGAVIDVENDDVNASRFKQELNVSVSGSFASKINSRDQLIVFMTDHGSNAVLGDGNATFHFEADNSFITEFEFYDLVKNINCQRMMINVDSCFSGNFLNQNNNIGQSWYDLPNCLFVSASSNVFSWYWINSNNGDGFAGSWFFHQFWEQLDQNQTVANAFNFASNFTPWNQWAPLIVTQTPLMHDNLGINTTWSFNSDPSL
ncbi:MAG: C13 family peptidase [Promethearchaeota archaeon]